MPPTIEQRVALLEVVWRLRDQRDYPAIAKVLATEAEATFITDPELGYLYAEAQYQLGRWDESYELVRQLDRLCSANGNDRLFRRRLNLEASLLLAKGHVAEANAVFEEVFDAATAVGDESYMADASNALGIVASIQSRWNVALVNYSRAMAAYQRLGHSYGLGGSHHNLAMTYRQLGRLHEADSNFDRALRYLTATRNVGFIATCEVERGLLRSLLGDSHFGRLLATRALKRFEEIGHSSGIANALRVLGVVATHVGEDFEAQAQLVRGLQFATSSGDRLTQAEILEELAVLDGKNGNWQGANEKCESATRVYEALGAFQRAKKAQERIGVLK